jgi:hypothetical protein
MGPVPEGGTGPSFGESGGGDEHSMSESVTRASALGGISNFGLTVHRLVEVGKKEIRHAMQSGSNPCAVEGPRRLFNRVKPS